MKGPSSPLSTSLQANDDYRKAEKDYMSGITDSIQGKFEVSGSYYEVYEDDVTPFIKKVEAFRSKYASSLNISKNEPGS